MFANHFSSFKQHNWGHTILGVVGPQPSQKSFETMLWNDFRKLDPSEGKIIWIENEGNKVGKVYTPQPLRKMITSSSKIFVKPSVDQRVDHIMREYTVGLCCQGILQILWNIMQERL